MSAGLHREARRAKQKERVLLGELSLQQYMDDTYDQSDQKQDQD